MMRDLDIQLLVLFAFCGLVVAGVGALISVDAGLVISSHDGKCGCFFVVVGLVIFAGCVGGLMV